MKLNNNQNSNLIISSNDVLVTANENKLLTDVINEQDEKLNNLEQNVKWLYKYGGTGSKGGNNPNPQSIIDLSCNIIFGNNIITKDVEKIILSNSGNIIPLSISLKKRNSLNTYKVKIIHNNDSNAKVQLLNDDNDYTLNVNINVTNIDSAYIKIELRGTSPSLGEDVTETYMFKYVTNPYNISLNILKADDSSILNNNDLYYNIANSNDVKLKINYNLESSNEIEYEIVQTGMFETNEGIINENHRGTGFVDIPFDKDFLISKDNIGLQLITVLFHIPYDETIGLAAHTITKELSFTYIPDDSIFFKIEPVNSYDKIYKYNLTSYESVQALYEDYVLYFNSLQKLSNHTFFLSENIEDRLLVYNKLNIDENIEISETDITNLINSACEIIENKLYIFNTGTLSLNVQAYKGDLTAGTIDIKCISGLNDNLENININISNVQYRKSQVIVLPIHEEGIYKFSIYSDIMAESERIYYYLCVLNKNNLINWYSSEVSKNFTLNCYYRAGEISSHSSIQKFKNLVYIQQYSSSSEKQLVHITESITTKEDILVSIGFQYSEINNVDNPILLIQCLNAENTTSNIEVYQNKIKMGNDLIDIYLPKESNYSPATKSNYHLLNIYKRYIYTSSGTKYYEVCVYLDGCLEGAFQSFINDSSGWDTILLESANVSVNLFELSYLMHSDAIENGEKKYNRKRFDDNGNEQLLTYLDDIAISEYYYKYVNTILDNSANVNSYEDAQVLLNELRSFKETDNGMMEVRNLKTIQKIAENVKLPVIMFNYNESSDNDFIYRFTKYYGEGFGAEGMFTLDQSAPLYYSSGKKELKLVSTPQELSGAYWYIELQGSSTGLYFCKNLTLGIKTTDKGYLPIFTPNFMYLSAEEFNKINPTETEKQKISQARDSYLPETAFTLKADCVDSSHSNNTAVGKFVNENTTPFDIKFKGTDGSLINSSTCTYVNYIKNCLLGYGCLVFIQVQNPDKTKTRYYYLGIYNFNLGRDSYFNMGYYSPQYLMNDERCNSDLMSLKTGDEFKVTYITFDETSSSLPISEGVIVAEIQGGNPRYDFSQYNTTMLLPQIASDKGAMFGDFVPEYDPSLSVGPSAKIRHHLPRLVKAVSNAGGYLFENVLHKHLGEYDWCYSKYIDNGVNSSIFDSANQVPNFRVQYTRNINVNKDKVNYYDIVKVNGEPYINNTPTTIEDLYYLISINSNEGETMPYGRPGPILDYVSVSEYYTVCMAFGLVDSVMKNLNVKTWDSTYVDSPDPDANNVGKWFIAFYDMDTSFGRNNLGSKTSYFAFSDYWKTSIDSTDLTPAIIYRDFFPAENKSDPNVKDQHIPASDAGFDVPSSYLFAIAKYAPLVGVGNFGEKFKTSTPQNIWARWRYFGTSGNTAAVGPGTGELKNANYFIDKYFIRNLDEIPEQLWTTNFRFKYLKRIIKPEGSNIYLPDTISGTFESKNIESFHGKGIYELREWLNGRFHILDAYFNLEGATTAINYLVYENDPNIPNTIEPVYENGNIICYKYIDNQKPVKDSDGIAFKWNTINAGASDLFDTVPLIDSNSLSGNNDIYILQDIFTKSGMGLQYTSDINLIIKAQKYSPLIIKYAQTEVSKYLLNNPNVEYVIYRRNTGAQEFKFGGSLLWTYIKNYNSLLVNNQITVTSPRLDSFTLTSGVCGAYDIQQMKSLKTISIKKDKYDDYSSFTGKLIIGKDAQTGKEIFPDLSKIELERTGIQLLVDGSSVQTINLSYTSIDTYAYILNCTNLNNVELNFFKCSEFTVSPGWSNNMVISNTSIKKLTLTPKNESASVRSIMIDSDSVLESVTLKGFTDICIKNCPNLFDICIQDPENVKSLEIIGAALNKAKYLYIHKSPNDNYDAWVLTQPKINGEINSEINLNEYVNLEKFSFYSSEGFNIIDLSNVDGIPYTINKNGESLTYNIINVEYNSFASTNVKEIKTKSDVYLYINPKEGTGIATTFNNSYYGGIPNNMIIGGNVTKIDDMFHCDSSSSGTSKASVLREFASVFLQNTTAINYSVIFENIDNIESMYGLFYGQSQLNASLSDNTSSLLSLHNFHNVSNIGYVFYGTTITSMNKTLFIGNNYDYDQTDCVGSNLIAENKVINIACCIPVICQITIDFFTPVINNIETLISDNPDFITYGFKIIDNNRILTEVNIKDLFNGLNVETNKIIALTGFNIDNSIKINFENLLYDFNNNCKKFPKLKDIKTSFCSDNVNNTNINLIGLNKYNNEVKLHLSFRFSSNLIERFNLNNFINFNTLSNNFVLYTSELSLMGAKEINDTDLINILESLNDANSKDISNLFNDTLIKTNRNLTNGTDNYYYELLLSNNDIQYNFIKCHGLFESAKLYSNTLNKEIGFTITTNTLKGFKNVSDWSNAFKNCIFHKNLPLNMFNQMINSSIEKPYEISNYNNKISDVSYMFSNVKLDNTPKSSSWFEYNWVWDETDSNYNGYYNNGVELNGSYHYDIKTLVSLRLDNPASYDKTLINQETHEYTYGLNIVKNLILPWDIFYGCRQDAILDNFISGSDFEGILPSLLFAGRLKKIQFKNVFNGVLVIPNKEPRKYHVLTKGIYNNNDLYHVWCNAYVFIPSGFTGAELLNEAFNFKMLMPNSEHSINTESLATQYYELNNDNNQLEIYFIFKNDSFDKQTLQSMKSSLPRVIEERMYDDNGQYTGTRSIYNIDSRKNDGISFSMTWNNRYDYGIHYYMNLYDVPLPDSTDENYPYVENDVINSSLTGLAFTGLLESMQNTMFNSDIMGLLYGALVPITTNINNIIINGLNTSLCQIGSGSLGYDGISYNIILPINGSSNGGYTYALSFISSATTTISIKNIQNQNPQSLENYINDYNGSNTNRVSKEIIDPNTNQPYSS